jgi:hypothetical protein
MRGTDCDNLSAVQVGEPCSPSHGPRLLVCAPLMYNFAVRDI